MARTRYYRDLIVWQKAMELARETYLWTEESPQSETFGLRMQMRRCSVSVAGHIADGHGRLNDDELKRALGAARGTLYELQTEIELALQLRFLSEAAARHLLELGTDTAKLINGLLRSSNTGSSEPTG